MARRDQPETPGDPIYEESEFPMDNPVAEDTDPEGTNLEKPYENNPSDRPPGERPSDGVGSHVGMDGEEDYSEWWENDEELISRAQSIYTASEDYLEANITNIWERSLAHFHSEHAPGTPYSQKNFKRSRVFRPKTRAVLKQQEAAMAVAAFSTKETADIEAVDPRDEAQRVSAQVVKNILQYRLDRRMPWFLTVMGAWQDSKVYGVAISHQYWNYEEQEMLEVLNEDGDIEFDDEGEPLGNRRTVVIKDEPVSDLIAPENFRFDGSADWRDPVNTSPYLIYIMPLYVSEVEARMERKDPKTGQPLWRDYSRGEILAAASDDYDRTRQAREGQDRIDPSVDTHKGNDEDLVWAHLNVIRSRGQDIAYWTLGTELVLSDPEPLHEVYPHLDRGERPFVLGYSSVEAHRNYPAGDVEQSHGLQEEINILTNQRIDNVKLALNKRYHVRRGAQVDLEALMRNVSGGGVMMTDPEKDVVTVNTPDVTSSSYEEHNRLAVEMDELVGNFSQGSVQGNRNLNETVGGMDQISASASAVQDYSIRVFMETWMEPVLRQLVKLIQYYETDRTILALAATNSDLWQKYGIDQVTDELLRKDLTVRVNLGMGNTDPVRRVERLVYAVGQVARLPGMPERMKANRIADEIFGALGHRDSSQFFMTDEEFEKFQQEQPEQPPPPDIQMKQEELKIRREDNQARDRREMMKLDNQFQLGMVGLALDRELKLADMFAQLGVDEMKDDTMREIAALSNRMKGEEMNLKRLTGEGI